MSFTVGLQCPLHSSPIPSTNTRNQKASAQSSSSSCPCRDLGQINLSWFTASEHGNLARLRQILQAKEATIYPSGKAKAKVKVIKNMNVNVGDSFGYTALHYAAQHNRVEVVKWLLQQDNIQVDAHVCGATPLHRAAFRGSFETCAQLVQHGADVNARDDSFLDARTPLHKAASEGHDKIVTLLLRYGADPSLVDNQGLTPAEVTSSERIKCLLLRH